MKRSKSSREQRNAIESNDRAVEDGLVLTPGGWRSRSSVYVIKPGHHISGKSGRLLVIETTSGNVIDDLGDVSTKKRIKNHALARGAQGAGPRDEGWIVYAYWAPDPGQTITSFNAQWRVPKNPPDDQNQSIFLFPGLQQSEDGPYILQPVLQWGPNEIVGGGKYWAVSSWYYADINSTAVKQSPVTVQPGDLLQASMKLVSNANNSFSYTCSVTGCAPIDTWEIAELRWACIAMEGYGATPDTPMPSCNCYPGSSVSFEQIAVTVGSADLTNVQPANLQWAPCNVCTNCGQSVGPVSNVCPGGSVTLQFCH